MQRGARDHHGRWGLLARLSMGIGAAVIAVGVLDCSLILDWSDYTASTGGIDWDAQIVDDGGADIVADSGASDSVVGDSLADVSRGPRCVPSAPAGWTGPVALYLGASGSQIPACGSDYPVPLFDGYEGLNAPPASCSPKCTCGAPEGGSCIPPDFTAYTDFCQTPCGSPVAVTYDTCSAPPSCTFSFFKVSAPGVNPGTCMASSISSTSPQATWSRVTRACGLAAAPPSGSCKSDEVWAPLPALPFSPRLCIMTSGKVDCPNSAYSQSTPPLYSTDAVVDTRGCSDCTCAPPAESSCSTQATSMMAAGVAYDSMCRPQLAQAFTVPTNGCQPLWTPGVQPSNLKLIQPLTLIPGSCAPGGGQPMGTVTPMGAPMTVCCTVP